VLDPTVADRQVRRAIYRQVDPETLREAVERTEDLGRRGDDHQFDFLADCWVGKRPLRLIKV
jgi:(2Fe-2S) ferredoxin